MARLDSHVGEMGYDNLVIRPGDVGYITLEAGQGILKRGSLVTEDNREAKGEEGASAVKNSVLATGGAGDAAYVLTDDVDTGAEAGEDGVVGTVYKNGKYIRESLTADGDITDADIKALRMAGIIVESGTHFPV